MRPRHFTEEYDGEGELRSRIADTLQ